MFPFVQSCRRTYFVYEMFIHGFSNLKGIWSWEPRLYIVRIENVLRERQ